MILVDPDWSDVEDLIFYLRTADTEFNVYVYKFEMENTNWLNTAIEKSQALIINTINTSISSLKDSLISNPKSYYYGEKRFLMSKNQINKPLDYFTQLFKKEINVLP